MARKRSFTDDELVVAVAAARSWGEVIRLLNLKAGGGTYQHIKALAQRLDLSTEHFSGQAWRRGSSTPVVAPRPLEDYLANKYPIKSWRLKQRLWGAGLKPQHCEQCGLTEWLGQPAPLQLDHVNGNPADNSLENLRILCPNCHAMTETFAGKKRPS